LQSFRNNDNDNEFLKVRRSLNHVDFDNTCALSQGLCYNSNDNDITLQAKSIDMIESTTNMILPHICHDDDNNNNNNVDNNNKTNINNDSNNDNIQQKTKNDRNLSPCSLKYESKLLLSIHQPENIENKLNNDNGNIKNLNLINYDTNDIIIDRNEFINEINTSNNNDNVDNNETDKEIKNNINIPSTVIQQKNILPNIQNNRVNSLTLSPPPLSFLKQLNVSSSTSPITPLTPFPIDGITSLTPATPLSIISATTCLSTFASSLSPLSSVSSLSSPPRTSTLSSNNLSFTQSSNVHIDTKNGNNNVNNDNNSHNNDKNCNKTKTKQNNNNNHHNKKITKNEKKKIVQMIHNTFHKI